MSHITPERAVQLLRTDGTLMTVEEVRDRMREINADVERIHLINTHFARNHISLVVYNTLVQGTRAIRGRTDQQRLDALAERVGTTIRNFDFAAADLINIDMNIRNAQVERQEFIDRLSVLDSLPPESSAEETKEERELRESKEEEREAEAVPPASFLRQTVYEGTKRFIDERDERFKEGADILLEEIKPAEAQQLLLLDFTKLVNSKNFMDPIRVNDDILSLKTFREIATRIEVFFPETVGQLISMIDGLIGAQTVNPIHIFSHRSNETDPSELPPADADGGAGGDGGAAGMNREELFQSEGAEESKGDEDLDDPEL